MIEPPKSQTNHRQIQAASNINRWIHTVKSCLSDTPALQQEKPHEAEAPT